MSSKKSYNNQFILQHNEKPGVANSCFVSWFVILTFVLTLLLVCLDSSTYNVSYFTNVSIFNLNTSITTSTSTISIPNSVVKNKNDCVGKYIYIQDLPSKFNYDLLENCSTLLPWASMCNSLVNSGFGPRLNESSDQKVFSNSSWFNTNQFSLEVIFHTRMKQYRCLTNDSSKATAIFVPFYAGLEVGRHLWINNSSIKDSISIEMAKYIKEKPEWNKMNGRDHFLVIGRITWDFRRESNKDDDWGNRLFFLPEVKNMTSLIIESSPWSNSDFAVPYPTYFHPSNDQEIFNWQENMRKVRRKFLFSFVGAPRPQFQDSIRNEIINQCLNSKNNHCKFMKCEEKLNNCEKPRNVMKLFQRSVFCLQPPGDSYTRRSAFDSILAGCIPVFFHPASAYVQYTWHLPKEYIKYSVFIPMEDVKKGNCSIEERLLKISEAEIEEMREEVIKLIPNVVYASPEYELESYEDAFDVSIKEVLKRVENIKMTIKERINSSYGNFPEDLSWKYNFFGELENHEWDSYFVKS
ncbi:xyloglucan galactosyltransferase MUR3-like [Silene latifolia]|uniref:xyloglucan galactosyltransferase MUR3-like n=1 Tax=Silene latifolia TaxID=37657 RepID=UPI003D7748E2